MDFHFRMLLLLTARTRTWGVYFNQKSIFVFLNNSALSYILDLGNTGLSIFGSNPLCPIAMLSLILTEEAQPFVSEPTIGYGN